MRFRVTTETLDADPDNETMDYIAATSPLSLDVEAPDNFTAISLAAGQKAVLVRIEHGRYGVRVYPVGPAAQVFADLAGTTTLTPQTVLMVRALGYGVTVTNGSPELPAEYGA